MEDIRALYYLPQPSLPAVRVYVRRNAEGDVEFRMWDAEHPEVWDKHDWITMEVIQMAASMFRQDHDSGWQPTRIYDSAVAEALIKEQEQKEAKARAKAERAAARARAEAEDKDGQ